MIYLRKIQTVDVCILLEGRENKMSVYYIDPMNGNNKNSGLSEKASLATNRNLKVQPGDTVLFKRGSFIRDALWNVSGEPGKPVIYGAYGEGANPVFCGSVDVSEQKYWEEVQLNLWKCRYPLATETCNLIFNDIECGALQWRKEDLKVNGDWWDSAFGQGERRRDVIEDHELLLYCEENPGNRYNHIECVLRVNRQLAAAGHDMIIQNLTFCNNGVHAIAGPGEASNLVIQNCHFEYIGGCVWNKEARIRFGNAVECWNTAENVTVEHCEFYEIYDSAVTHQGGENCRPAKGFFIRDNIFMRCGMAAYEQRDVLPKEAEFTHNICMDAGCGFSHFGITLPRQSEIWPRPMGHHIFLWRIEKPTEGSNFRIQKNVFLDAPHGAAIYSIICREAEEQTMIEGNIYKMKEYTLCNRLYGQDFEDFAKYASETGKDQNSRYFA